MGQGPAAALLFAALLAGPPAWAGTVRITGTVHTQAPGTAVTARAWALGRWGVDHPGTLTTAVTEGTIQGHAFSLDVPKEALPVRVEVSAKGHIAQSFTVAIPEQASLPPVLLVRGRKLVVRVVRGKRPVKGAAVWGDAGYGSWANLPGTWQPALARQATDAAGRATFTVPAEPFELALSAVGPEGHWTTVERWRAQAGTLRVELATVPLPVLVALRDGQPANGVLVTCAEAPAGTGVLTGADGTASLQVSMSHGFSAQAEADGRLAWARGMKLPAKGKRVRLVLDTPPSVALHLAGVPTRLVIEPEWFGGASSYRWIGAGDGTVDLPTPAGGSCTVWGPGVTPTWVKVDPSQPRIALAVRRAASVLGRVVDPVGNPVAGAMIVPRVLGRWQILRENDASTGGLRPLPYPLAVSGADGRFQLAGLPAGPEIVEARAAGFPPARSRQLPLPPGSHEEVVLKLARGTTLSLRVTDAQGQPLAGVQVGVHPAGAAAGNPAGVLLGEGIEGEPLGEPMASGMTNAGGRVTLRAVPVGECQLQLRHSGYVTRNLDHVKVPEGGADLGEVQMEPGITVSGTVKDPDGHPVPSAEVMATRTAESPIFNATVTAGEDGGFEIPDLEASGELYLQAQAKGFVPAPPLKVTLPPEGEVTVHVLRERTLSGQVVESMSGAPVAGATVTLTAIRTMKVPGLGAARTFVGVGHATTGAGGIFRIGGLAPGHLRMSIKAHGYQEAKREIDIPEQSEPQPLLIELEKGAEIRGRVVDPEGQPVAGATVATMGRTYAETRSDAGGSFVLDGLAPGAYELAADGAGLHGEATGTAGADEELTIHMRRPRKILGLVLGPEGAPVTGARIQAWGATRVPPVQSGADGRFTLTNIFPDQWTVSAVKKGLVPASKEVTVPEDRDASVELHLKRGGTVEGEIRGLSASELERCQVNAGTAAAAPGADGHFVLHGVPVGTVTVMAIVRPGNRSRGAVANITDPETPAHVTIDFAGGVTLSGTITRAGLPVQGLLVRVTGMGKPGGGGTATDADGAFSFTGLEPGEYQLQIRSGAGEPLGGRHLTLSQDTEIELEVPAGGIEGTVTGSETGEPVSGAALVARRVGLPEIEKRASSGTGGDYRFQELPDGTYSLTVTAEGFRAASATVSVADGLMTHRDLSLEPGEGVVLVVTEPDGSPAPGISVVPMANGIIAPPLSVSCDAGGRCRLKNLPTGDWTLLVRSDGEALLRVKNPGPEVPVQLRHSGTLKIVGQPGEDGALWRVRIVDRATGLLFPVDRWHNPGGTARVPVPAGGLELTVPEGDYTVEGTAGGGRSASTSVTITPGGNVVTDLDNPAGP